jgi:predicted amidohydrolase
MAEEIPGGSSVTQLSKKAKELETYIVAGTILEKEKSKIYNTSVLFGPNGEVIGKQRKTHPENHASKREVDLGITPGDELNVYDTELGKIGILIDVDANVPEIPRAYALKGADIICWPLNWSVRWSYLIPAIASAYAFVTQCYFIASDRAELREEQVGPYPLYYRGPSIITNPEGEIIGFTCSYYEGMALAEISTEILSKIRAYNKETYPLWRRPKVFKSVID